MKKTEILHRVGIYWKWLSDNESYHDETGMVEFRFWSEGLTDFEDEKMTPIQVQRHYLGDLQIALGAIGFIPTLHGPTDDNDYDMPSPAQLRYDRDLVRQVSAAGPSRLAGWLIVLFLLGLGVLLGYLI